jgi:HSP20 family protein
MVERFALTRRSPLRRLTLWEREMDRFLGHRARWFDWPAYTWRRMPALEREYFAPMEVFERDGQTVVKLELPGVELENIDISLTNGLLTIKGEKKHEEEVTEGDYYRSERTYGSFRRTLAVPAGIDGSKISATYEGGVLELMLPAGETQEHKVEVTAKAAKAPKAKGTRTKKAKAKKE